MTEYWVKQGRAWRENGTFERLNEAEKKGTQVKVERSDGSISIGVLDGGGFGGHMLTVKIEKEGKPTLWKNVHTEEFLELNPEFGPSLMRKHEEEKKGTLGLIKTFFRSIIGKQ